MLETNQPAIVADTRARRALVHAAPTMRQRAAGAVGHFRAAASPARQLARRAGLHPPLPGALGEEHLPLIESIAGQVAVALENEQLRQLQRVQGANAQSLAGAAQAMTRTLNEAELHQIVVDQISQPFSRTAS